MHPVSVYTLYHQLLDFDLHGCFFTHALRCLKVEIQSNWSRVSLRTRDIRYQVLKKRFERTASFTSTCEATCGTNETFLKRVAPFLIFTYPLDIGRLAYMLCYKGLRFSQPLPKVRHCPWAARHDALFEQGCLVRHRKAVRITWPSLKSPREHSAIILSSRIEVVYLAIFLYRKKEASLFKDLLEIKRFDTWRRPIPAPNPTGQAFSWGTG
jgi:hypothetical protein